MWTSRITKLTLESGLVCGSAGFGEGLALPSISEDHRNKTLQEAALDAQQRQLEMYIDKVTAKIESRQDEIKDRLETMLERLPPYSRDNTAPQVSSAPHRPRAKSFTLLEIPAVLDDDNLNAVVAALEM